MKHQLDMRVREIQRLNHSYALIKFTPINGVLPADILPGQFAQVEIKDSPRTFLRRPISICFVDYSENELWMLVRIAGEGTKHLVEAHTDDIFNIIFPLGHAFSIPKSQNVKGKVLLVGGGVGVAPLLYLGKQLFENGLNPEFVLGAKTSADLLLLDEFAKYGPVHTTTEDGSHGSRGFVTQHEIWQNEISHIACCGPTPMMKAVAKIAQDRAIFCEASLENMMACGIGACLCCVEDIKEKGNVCVCTDGPVFNTNELKWNL